MSKPLYRKIAGATEAALLGLSPAAWFKPGIGVTGTLTASAWADQSGNGRNLEQGTAGNQPFYLSHVGTDYAYLPGVAGNCFTTPDAVPLDITGSFDIDVCVAADDWTPSATQLIIAKDTALKRTFALGLLATTGVLYAEVYDTASTQFSSLNASSAAPVVSDGGVLWLRWKFTWAATGNCLMDFYTSADGVTWSALGVQKTNAATGNTLANYDNALYVGQREYPGNANAFLGKIYRARVYSGDRATGTLVADFNPSTFVETSTNGTTATASTGEVWTLNSTGSIPARIVKAPLLFGEGTARKMATAAYVGDQPRTVYAVVQANTWTAADYIFSGVGAEAGVTQVTGTPKIGLNAGSGVADNTGLVLGEWHIVTAVLNGASSSLTVDAGTPTTGDAGANDPDGLTLFSNSAGAGYFNGGIKELIDFSAAHDADTRLLVQQYLAARHGISL